MAFASRKLHRDVADLAMLVVNGAHLHIGAVDEPEVGVDRATAVCCSKRRDASGTSVWKRGAVWNTIIIIINYYLPWGAAAIAVATHLAWCARWARRHRILEPGA